MSFDNDSRIWDTNIRINRAEVVAKEISKSIDINKNYTAMEFGCGTGLVSFNLHEKFKSIVLVDSSQGMIEMLNSKIERSKVSNMTSYYLDITNKDSLDMKFDVIYTSMVLHHIDDIKATIKKLYELLNKDGYLFIVDLDEEDGSFHKNQPDFHGHNGFNQDYLRDILISCGFQDVELNTLFYDEKLIGSEGVKYSLFLMKGRI